MVTEFRGHIFDKDETLESNQDTLRERPLLIGFVLVLFGILLFVLDLKTLGFISFFSGWLVYILSKFSLLTPKIKKSSRGLRAIIINSKGLQIDEKIIGYSETEFVKLNLRLIQGQLDYDMQQVWKSDGRSNTIDLRIKNKTISFNLLLSSIKQVNALRLIEFPDNVTLDDGIF